MHARAFLLFATLALVACGNTNSHDQAAAPADAGEADSSVDSPGPRDAWAEDVVSENAADSSDASVCENKFEGLSPIESSCGWTGERGAPYGVWGSSASDIYVVGRHGFVTHYDGSAWTQLDLGTYENLWGVWGTAPDNIFITGSDWVYRFDGKSWRRQQVEGNGLGWVWGLSACSVFSTGEPGALQHFDGTSWSRFPSPGDPPGGADPWAFASVWGTSDNDLYLVGNVTRMVDGAPALRGKIAHYDGSKWTEMVKDAGIRLHQLWGTAADDLYAVGGFNSDALILHYDGHAWTPVLSDSSWELTSIWGRSASDVYAAGWGRVLHYDGSSWTQVASSPDRPVITGLFGTQDGIWFAADSGIVRFKNDELSFALRWPVEWSVEAMSGCSGAEPFAVGFASQGGTKSLILRRQAGDWQPMATSATSALSGVWCVAPNDAYAVGENSTILHYDGADWKAVALPTSPGWLNGVWAASADEVFVVGENGAVLRGAGDQWEGLDTGTDARLRAVWGTGPSDVFAAGDGVLLHYDGAVWTKEASGQFRGVWGADKDNIFAASQS